MRWGVPLLAVVVGLGALYLLEQELSRQSYRAIAHAVAALPTGRLGAALVITAACYVALFFYDWLALRYVGRPLPTHRTMLASLVAYGFSQSLGVSALTGASVRYRFWSLWGLAPADIARGVAFTTVTFWLGALTLSGVAMVGLPSSVERAWPGAPWRLVGAAQLVAIVAYLLWAARRERSFRLLGSTLHAPGVRLALSQLLVACADWVLAGTVLWTLLPHEAGLSLRAMLGFFVVAQVLGLLSHVPGGAGVFEAAMLAQLRPFVPVPEAVAALVAYRGIYYLVPLAAAALALGTHEMVLRRASVARAARAAWSLGRVIPAAAPFWLGGATFAAGVLLLASGSTPGMLSRLRWLDAILPLAVIEVSHFTASIAGVALLLVANGLRRRLDAAWHVAVALLAVGIAASLVKGGDYEEAASLGLVLGALLPARRHFYRRAALFGEPLSPEWTAAVLLATVATTWLGFFSYKHIDFRADLWWRFATAGDAPRFLRATVGVAVALISYALWRLLGPQRGRTTAPTLDERSRAQTIARTSPRAEAALAQVGDKALLFSPSGRGFIMYGVHRRIWVALGDPVAPPDESPALVRSFCDLADRHGGRPVFYQIGSDNLALYVDAGLTIRKLGEEARVPLSGFSLDGGVRKWLRRALRDGERAGLTMEIVEPPHPHDRMAAVGSVSERWLAGHRTREKGFSLGYLDPTYFSTCPLALVYHRGRVVAFANIWYSGGNEEMSVDLMRHDPEAPAGVMDFLFGRLILHARDAGYHWFNLGMAPLSGIERQPLAPLWTQLGALVFRHGEHFYNFRGLRQYKEKFAPVWKARYLALPGAWALPSAVAGVAALTGRGLRGVVAR